MKTTFLLFTTLLMGCFMSHSQTVTTFTEGTPDDAIAIDANGNIYCSNYVGDTVFKFTPEGEVTSFITGLNTPNGLAFNSNQELYVCDGQGNTIYKYDLDGDLLNSYPAVGHPSGIVKSVEDESMIFTLYTGNKIMRLETDGTITEISLAPELNGPVGIAYDDTGDLYIGNYNDRKIYRVLGVEDLEYVAEVPTDGGAYPNLGFITYGQGKLWGTSMGSDKIYSINPNAIDDVTLFAGTTQGSEDGDISVATFNTPNGIYYDQVSDKLYVTDFGTKNLRIISGLVLGNDDSDSPLGFQVVPNPIEDKFEIKTGLPIGETYSVKVFDVLGKLIFQNYQMHDSEKISTATWSKGPYFVQLKYQEGWLVKQIVK
jgi:DNA-binding beta-propeller fold protein YncE